MHHLAAEQQETFVVSAVYKHGPTGRVKTTAADTAFSIRALTSRLNGPAYIILRIILQIL